jgi:hypothetical protein
MKNPWISMEKCPIHYAIFGWKGGYFQGNPNVFEGNFADTHPNFFLLRRGYSVCRPESQGPHRHQQNFLFCFCLSLAWVTFFSEGLVF